MINKPTCWILLFSFLGSAIFLTCSSKSNTGKSKLPVTIHLTQTSSYCGGAAPPEELLQALATPQILPGEKFYIRSGNKNNPDATPLAEAVSNQNGDATFQLSAGEYYIVFENKLDRSTFEEYKLRYGKSTDYYDAIDLKCLEDWLVKPELVFLVSDTGANQFTLNVHKPCSWNSVPCAQFTGSLPP